MLYTKLERAKKHIGDLETEWKVFFENHGYDIAYDDDVQRRERRYYLAVAKDIPPVVPLIVGDAIHNLRSSLDHLAHHLVAIGRGVPGPFRGIYFPIHESAAVYKVKSPGQIKGMRKAAIDAIDAIEPYGGGAGHTLWQIHRLDNIDKHRLLLTVYGELLNHSLLPSQREQIIKGFLASHPGSPAPDLTGVYIAPGRRLPPLKEGDTLLTIPESEMEQYMNFSIGIAFGEPEVLQGNSVIPTLQGMAQFVELILRKFADLGLLS